MKIPSKSTNTIDLDVYSKSLLSEASKEFGNEFDRLPKRIQTGYIKVFHNHSGIIRHNQHIKRSDSFVMCEEEVQRYFTDRKMFRAVNDTGYWLRPNQRPKTDKYVLRLKEEDGAIGCDATGWIIKTIMSSQGSGGGTGYCNGYQLSPEVRDLVAACHAKSDDELGEERGFVNHKGESILEIAAKLGGAISRDKSVTSSEVNVSVFVTVDKQSLSRHKKQVETVQRWLEIMRVDTLTYNSKEWKEVSAKVIANDEEEVRKERRPHTRQALGGVNREVSLQSLLSKDFTLEGAKQRLIEINTLLSTSREERGSVVHVFYTEVSTGRYTAQGAILQGYHKSVRYAALKGCYEYDLEAAHQNILIQLLDQQNSSFPELDVVRDYIANKQKVRNRLAKELITTVSVVKEIIQELTYGAQLNRGYKGSIYKTCKGDKVLLDRVCNNDWFKKLEVTFKLAHKHLASENEEIVNAVGIKFDKKGDAKELAHILQGYERLVLDVIIKHSNREDIALLVHDCVVFYNKQSTDRLSQIVEQETGLRLAFSEEKY